MKNEKKQAYKFRFFAAFAVTSYLLCIILPLLQVSSIKTQKSIVVYASQFSGQAECVMEMNSRRVLYEYHADTRLPMASTTKILTAITAIEHCGEIKRLVNIPEEAIGIEGSSVYLNKEEEYTVEDLLYGLMLRSGNDCAVALSHVIAGGSKQFSTFMNQTAEKAGALSSCFVNPHGLPQENHYTTAKDLTNITCYAMHNNLFCEIVSTKYYPNKKWANKNKLLSTYDGCCGVKTGYTKQAGRCLVSAAKRGDMTLVCTLLNCPTTYERTIKLFDDSFERYQNYSILSVGQTFDVEINGATKKLQVKDNFSYPMLAEEIDYLEIQACAIENAQKTDEKGEILGQIKIYLSKRLLFLGNLYKL